MSPDDLEFVILAAGRSTRNYPHSKGIPHKALVPFGSIKVIDHIIKEPLCAGLRNITIVVSDESSKEAFESCFKPEPKIEEKFRKSGNTLSLELLQSLYMPDGVDIKYVIQDEPKGLAHAVGLAAKASGGRHLVVRLPDDMVITDRRAVGPRAQKSFVERVIERYVADGIGGNMLATRHVDDPARWGIIENGIFREKPRESSSHEASHTLLIFDRAVAKRLEAAAEAADTPGAPEYGAWRNEGRELHYGDYINEMVKADPAMAIRAYPLSETDIYLDCGTLQGYEEASLYMLLRASAFRKKHRETARRLLSAYDDDGEEGS
jgi:UTP-glucose-1-phosphate uridylyltransferase